MRDTLEFLGLLVGTMVLIPGLMLGTFPGISYYVSSESTVNAINAQCGTNYQRIDYLRIGEETMRDLCRIKEQTINLKP
jgi:hypothetical protein